jgi:hypothetical protein
MKALAVRQPYAWLIVAGRKPIENRSWKTEYRGPLLIHSALKMHVNPVNEIKSRHAVKIDLNAFQFGGIIGQVELVDIVTQSTSPWFQGTFGWILERPRFVRFTPWRGLQGFFEGPDIDFCVAMQNDRTTSGKFPEVSQPTLRSRRR